MSGADAQSRITIDLWRTTYVVSSGHPTPEDFRGRLDELVTARLPEVCAQWLSDALDPADESVWLIRELDLDFTVQAGRHAADRLPSVWGRQLAVQVTRAIARGPVGDSVLYFPSRAAYLAHFLRDLAGGRAWDKWYYSEFDSLHSLSHSRAIAETLSRDPATAGAVLLHLASVRGLREILEVLTPADAAAIYHAALAPPADPAAGGASKWAGTLLELWNDKPLLADGDNPFRDGLWLAALAGSRSPEALRDSDFSAALDGFLHLRRVLAQVRSASVLDALIRGLAARGTDAVDELSALAAKAGADDPAAALRFFAAFMQGDADLGAQAAGVLLSDEYLRRSAANPVCGQTVLSRFAGIFRLGASFLAAGCESAIAEPVLRRLIAIQCLGAARAAETESDPATRLFSGSDAPLPAALAGLRDTVDPGEIQLALLRHLVESGRADGRCLVADPIASHGAILFRDLLRNDWLWAAPLTEDPAAVIRQSLARISSLLGAGPQILILAGGLSDLVVEGTQVTTSETLASAPADLAAAFSAKPERLARLLKSAWPDFNYFSLAAWHPGAPSFDLACTLAARAVMRHFSRRLIGFDTAGPEHLYTNFLAGRGTLLDTGDRIEVALPAPPLSVILRMAGIDNEVYPAPWIGREVWLQISE